MWLISWKLNLHWISLSQRDQKHDSASGSRALIINSTVLFPCSIKTWLCQWPGFSFTKEPFPGHNKTVAWIISLKNSMPLSLWSIVGKPNKLSTLSIKFFCDFICWFIFKWKQYTKLHKMINNTTNKLIWKIRFCLHIN